MKVSDLQGLQVVSTPQTKVADWNNPLNLKVGGQTQKYITGGQAKVGPQAPDGGNFLVFNDRNAGVTAAHELMFGSGVYKGLTVDQALRKWSNNGYGGDIVPSLATSSIDSLTPEQQSQVLGAMEMKGENDAVAPGVKRVADFKPGELSVVPPSTTNKPVLPQQSSGLFTPGPDKSMQPINDATTGIAKGIAKGVGASVFGTLSALQDVGQGVGNIARKAGLPIPQKSGIPQLDTSTPEGKKIQESYTAQSGPEMIGKGIETVAELAMPTTLAAKGAKELPAIKGILDANMDKNLTKALTPTVLSPKTKEKLVMAGQEALNVKNTVSAMKNVAQELGTSPLKYVKSGVKTAAKNITGIQTAIKDYATKVVSPFLKANPVSFNFQDLRDALESVAPRSGITKGAAFDTYGRVREQILTQMGNYIKGTGRFLAKDDFNDIWNARKIIDAVLSEETKGKAFTDEAVQGAQAAAQDMRGALKQYLSDSFRYRNNMEQWNKIKESAKTLEQRFGRKLTDEEMSGLKQQMGLVESEADKALSAKWDKSMENMSSLYDGVKNLLPQAKSELGKSWGKLFAKEHPVLTKVLQDIGIAVGIGTVGGEAIKHL